MKSYQDWLTEGTKPKAEEPKEEKQPIQTKEEKKIKANKRPNGKKLRKHGGVYVDPTVQKRVDLIVLPGSVEGACCGNCMYFEKSGDMGWCQNPEVKQWVTARMYCHEWDHKDVKRPKS